MIRINPAPPASVYALVMTAGQQALALWLRRLEMRSPLIDSDHATVMGLPGQIRHFRSSRDLVRMGERTQSSCLVVDGMVARFGQTSDGHRQLTALYVPGDMADLHSAVLPLVSAPLQSTAQATIYSVPHDAIRHAAESSPTLARAFWRDCVADAQIGSEWLLNIGRRSALTRVAHLICELTCRYGLLGIASGGFPLFLTQTHMGEALGLTGVHVNRMLRDLRGRELIRLDGSTMTVLDDARLKAVADFDPDYLHLRREVEI